jgi:hypothetical protein
VYYASVVGPFQAKPGCVRKPRPVGLGKGDEKAWRCAWGGPTATANAHQAC